MKKYAKIYSKNYVTKELEYEGEAMLLNCLDQKQERSFWEIRFLNNINNTSCRWIQNSNIIER